MKPHRYKYYFCKILNIQIEATITLCCKSGAFMQDIERKEDADVSLG